MGQQRHIPSFYFSSLWRWAGGGAVATSAAVAPSEGSSDRFVLIGSCRGLTSGGAAVAAAAGIGGAAAGAGGGTAIGPVPLPPLWTKSVGHGGGFPSNAVLDRRSSY